MQTSITNISSRDDVLTADGTDSPTPARIESWSNSTSVTSKPTEAKLELENIGESPRTVDKNITSVSDNSDEFNSTNHMPNAKDQSVIIDGNKAPNIVLKAIDQDNDKITFDLLSGPVKGVLVGFDKNTGNVVYVPNPGSEGTDRFTFKAVDSNNLQSNVAQVSVIVNPIQNTGPKLADVNVVTSSNEPVILTVKTSNHENGNRLKFDAISGPSHGKLTKFTNIDHNSATVTYTPKEDYSGNDAFIFKAYPTNSDGSSISDIAKASITIIAAPHDKDSLPLISLHGSESDVTSNRTQPSQNSSPVIKSQKVSGVNNEKVFITLNGHDADGDKLRFSIVSYPSHGRLVSFDSLTGKVIYEPDNKFNGVDFFSYKVTDQKRLI